MRHGASVSATNALIAEVRVWLARAAWVFVEYDNPQAGRYRTALSEPGAAHAIPIVRLRPETTYDYTIFVVEGGAAAAGPGGSFTTGPLPPPLAALRMKVTGRSFQRLILSNYRRSDGQGYFVLWDEVGGTVWYYDELAQAGPIGRMSCPMAHGSMRVTLTHPPASTSMSVSAPRLRIAAAPRWRSASPRRSKQEP